MLRLVVFISLAIVCVSCQTTEEPLELSTDLDTGPSWEEWTTDGTTQQENFTAIGLTQKEFITGQTFSPASFTTMDQTQEELNNTLTAKQQSSTIAITSNSTSTPCPLIISRDAFEQMKKEIIDTILLAISHNVTNRLEKLEAQLTTTFLNGNTPESTSLAWQIYENLGIPLNGWTRVFDQPYSHRTRSADLDQAAGLCQNQTIVAATINGSISLAGVGPASVLTMNTKWNQPKLVGQVYWYRTTGKSFGFSPGSIIRQTPGDNEDLSSPTRLSWLLDQDYGGYRAGATRLLANSSLWHKVIYCN